MPRKPKRKGATRAEFAAHVGLTPQRVGQMIAEKVIPLHEDGSIDTDGARLAYIDALRSGVGRSDSAQRVQDVRAEMLRFRLEKERGEWIRLEEINMAIGEITGVFCSELHGVAAASTRELAQREVFQANLNAAIERCKSRLAGLADAAKSGRPLFDDAGGDNDEA